MQSGSEMIADAVIQRIETSEKVLGEGMIIRVRRDCANR